jgi:hypothetical protein
MEDTTVPNSVAPVMKGIQADQLQLEAAQLASDEHLISFFENGLPSLLEAEMISLYGNFFSAPAKFRAYGQLDQVGTYVARNISRITAIFVVRVQGNRIHVLNEQIEIDEAELKRFAEYMFARFKKARMICFKTVQAQLSRFPFSYHRVHFTNDVVLPLPDSASDYLTSLGKSTRENIKRYLKLLKRDFPSYAFEVTQNNDGGDARFRAIIEFNHERMNGKNKVSGITPAEADRLHALVKECGLVCAVVIDGRVCAGTICYQVGDNYFMRVIAHDSRYSDYRLGVLCCYLSICECIARGGKNYHFLWGREEYKYRFLGQHRDFDSLTLYRSTAHYLADISAILKSTVKAKINEAKLWVLAPANADKKIPRYVRRGMTMMKTFRQRKRSTA